MQLIQKIVSTEGELKLGIAGSAFESALRRQTYPAESENITGYAIKFDQENHPQTYIGHIGNGQFQLRAVKKSARMEMANFLINGHYKPDEGGVSVAYTISLNPNAIVLWLIGIVFFFIQLLGTKIFVSKAPSFVTMYAVVIPFAGAAYIVYHYRKMLAPSRQQFEADLNSLAAKPAEAISFDATTRKNKNYIVATLLFMGSVFLLAGVGSGLYAYRNAWQATEPAVGVVESMRGSRKAYYPVISYTPKDGIPRSYYSNFGSSSPMYEIGDTVHLYYDPANPSVARLDTAVESWFFPANFGIGGLVVLIIAGIAYRNRTKEAPFS